MITKIETVHPSFKMEVPLDFLDPFGRFLAHLEPSHHKQSTLRWQSVNAVGKGYFISDRNYRKTEVIE